MRVIIDGREILSEADLHRALADPLDFGPYYGNSLAALRDRLTTDVERPVQLVWTHWEESRDKLGGDLFDKLCGLLKDVQAQDEKMGYANRFAFELR